jgi:hypothetical protein
MPTFDIDDWQDVPEGIPASVSNLAQCTALMSYLPSGQVTTYLTVRRELAEWVSGLNTRSGTLKVSGDYKSLRIDHDPAGKWHWAKVGSKKAVRFSYRLRLGILRFWPSEQRAPESCEFQMKGSTLFVRLPANWTESKGPGILANGKSMPGVPEFVHTCKLTVVERFLIEQLLTQGRRAGIEYLRNALLMDSVTFQRIVRGLSRKLRMAVLIQNEIMETSGALAISAPDRERLQTAVADSKVKAA